MSRNQKRPTGRGRPAALRVAAIEVRCQDCGATQPNPVTGSNEWSPGLYGDVRKNTRGRVACSNCSRTLELGGVVFDVILDKQPQPDKEPST